jgi:hypothetical protein
MSRDADEANRQAPLEHRRLEESGWMRATAQPPKDAARPIGAPKPTPIPQPQERSK